MMADAVIEREPRNTALPWYGSLGAMWLQLLNSTRIEKN